MIGYRQFTLGVEYALVFAALLTCYLKTPIRKVINKAVIKTQNTVETANAGIFCCAGSGIFFLAGFRVRYRVGEAAAKNKAKIKITIRMGAHAKL